MTETARPAGRRNRNAAAVILVRGDGGAREVLLVERSPELRFFGGYLAAPGGVRSPVDGADEGGDDSVPLLRCAGRELFEETGVLLAPDSVPADQRQDIREQLLAGDDHAWGSATAGQPLPSALRPACRIRTPPFAPVRYDTLFAFAELPPGEEVDIRHGELVGGRFWRPAAALEAWRRGELLIVPPLIILLELLDGSDIDRFIERADAIAADYRRGKLHRVQFSPGVILAPLRTPTLPPATTTNCLIVGEQRLLVIDPATPDDDEQQRLFELLDELRAEGREIEAVIATHHHPDHVGAVRAVSERFAVPVRGHELTLSRIDCGSQPTEPIGDGDVLPLGIAPDGSDDWHLRAIHTPGHDRGHLCFVESRYRALIAGDMVSTISTIVIDPPEGHMATYLDSLQRLAALELGTLYPAHGPAVRDGERVLKHFIAHRNKRQSKLESILQREPATAATLLPQVYDDVDERMLPVAARSLEAGLQMAEETGRATRDGEVWRTLRNAP